MSVTQRPRRRTGVLGTFLALVLALVLIPSGTAQASDYTTNTPVMNQLQQAYTASRVTPAGVTLPAPVEYFLHGNAVTGTTFNTTAPTSPAPMFRMTSPLANENQAGNTLAAFWRGTYPAGPVDGQLGLRWWWQSANAAAALIGADVEISVFADAANGSTPSAAQLISRSTTRLTVGPQPTENITVVPIRGTVASAITIQVVPTFIDTGQALTAVFDSTTYPSGFAISAGSGGGGGAGGRPANVAAAYTGPPLVVQSNYVGRDSAEPTIGVNPDGTAFYAAGAFDAIPVSGAPTNLARTEVLRSRDGGATWESVQATDPTGTVTVPPTTLDPYVYVEESTGRMFNPELYGGCTYLNYSDDEGESYTQNPAACGSFVNDHQTLFSGPLPATRPDLALLQDLTGDPDYPEVLYYCFNRIADANCGRSVDGGLTFFPVETPAYTGVDPAAGGFCGGLHGHIATDSEGRLFVPKGHCGNPWVSISDDAGQSWTRVKVSTISAAGTHLAMAVDAEDNLYFTWWDATDRLPYLATSTDHGLTWSAPLMIAPPGVFETNFPVITAGDAGRIALTFPGTTTDNQADATRPWNAYVTTSVDALAENPLFVSTTANDPADPIHRGTCGPGRCAGMFDFLDIIVSPHDGSVWATATDTCTAACISATGPANDEDGYSIRQLSGPQLVVADAPPPVIPESPLAALLPLAAGAVLLGAIVRRRRAGLVGLP